MLPNRNSLIRCKFEVFMVVHIQILVFRVAILCVVGSGTNVSEQWECSHVLLYRQDRMNVVTQNRGKITGRQTSRRSNKMTV